MTTNQESHFPSVHQGVFWRLFGNRGIEWLPASAFDLTEEDIRTANMDPIAAHTMHNQVYQIEKVDGWGVYTDEWDVFATEELAKNFLAGVDVDT